MDPDDFSVPGVLESPLGAGAKKKPGAAVAKEPPSRRALKRKKEEAQVVVYGAKKNDASLAATAKHQNALAPVVNELAALEKEIQQLFASAMWGNYSGGKGRSKGVVAAAPAPVPQQAVFNQEPQAAAPAAES